MTTAEVLKLLKAMLPPAASLVSSLGRTSDEAWAHFPDQTLFLDSMGDVTTVACGVALGMETHPVVALDTDGSHLLGLAALPTLGALAPRLNNLAIFVLDNGIYESGSGLPSRDCALDWVALGRAFGLPIREVATPDALTAALADAFKTLTFTVVRIANTDRAPDATKTLDGLESRYRFCRHLERLTGKIVLHPATKS
jgi:thiamine pyrophosphate-dependent acetolactate synthase large subunit-like protein